MKRPILRFTSLWAANQMVRPHQKQSGEYEQWECLNCGSWDEINCVDYEYDIDLEDENFIQGYADGQEFENPYPPEDDQNHIANMGDLPF